MVFPPTFPRKLPRHLRNEEIPSQFFTPRTYQVDLLDVAIQQNTIVCLGSESGKSFVGVMLIKELANAVRQDLERGGKRSVYLVPSENEVFPPAQCIQQYTDLNVAQLDNEEEVMDWQQEKWKEKVNKNHVIVTTFHIFYRHLLNDHLPLTSINLMILEDCHTALESDSICSRIMKQYGDTMLKHRPRLLGFTTSLLKHCSSNPQELTTVLKELENKLYSTAETSNLVTAERYGPGPKLVTHKCQDRLGPKDLTDRLINILESALDFLFDCNVPDCGSSADPRAVPTTALSECLHILHQLGPWCCAAIATTLMKQLDKIDNHEELELTKRFLKFAASQLRLVNRIFEEHFASVWQVEEFLTYVTPKVAKLLETFKEYKPTDDFMIIAEEENSDDSDMSDDSMDLSDDEEDTSPAKSKSVHIAVKRTTSQSAVSSDNPLIGFEECQRICGIVFVERRHVAYALNKLIDEMCAWDTDLYFLKSHHILGDGMKKGGKREALLFRKQEEVLRKFRMQELNLLVSTTVLEEGVDIPKCNLVVRFDLPGDYRSYTLSKSRACARNAQFVLLVDDICAEKFYQNLEEYRGIESVLLEKCQNRGIVNEEISLDNTPLPPYQPIKGEENACVTMVTAISLVNRYCAKLPSDAFTHLTPKCTIVQIDGPITQFYAKLRLPINSPVKEEIHGAVMPSRGLAQMAVALETCEILHKEGELDDQLLPVGKEVFRYENEENDWEEEVEEGQARPGTTKRKQYYIKKAAEKLQNCYPKPGFPCVLYNLSMTLTGPITEDQNTRGRKIHAPEETTRSFGILVASEITNVPLFPVYTRSGEVTVNIQKLSSDILVDEDQFEKLLVFHKFVFSSVLRLEKDPMEFLPLIENMNYVVVPLNMPESDENQTISIDWQFVHHLGSRTSPIEQAKIYDAKREKFEFQREYFQDAVVMPSYRNIDQPQYFYVAEIRTDLSPLSPFPSPDLYKTFKDYYAVKYGLMITNTEQPLLDVDHTSARLNLLTPRYMNQKGIALPTSSADTKKSRRENLQQKQILIPELCDVHIFPASLWRKAVCLPAILYRVNYLLIAEDLRARISRETHIGVETIPHGFQFPKLDFGFSTCPEKIGSTNGTVNDENTKSDINVGDNVNETTLLRQSNANIELLDSDKECSCTLKKDEEFSEICLVKNPNRKPVTDRSCVCTYSPDILSRNDEVLVTEKKGIPNTTEDEIVNTTEDQIVNTTEDQIVNTTEDQIVNTTEDQIVNTTEDQIVNTTEDQIVNTTEDQIVNTTEDQIVNTTEDQIVNTTEDQIVHTTEDQIVNTTEDQIVNTTEDQIVNTTEDQIVNTTEDQIVNTTEDQIVHTTEDQIVNTTEEQIVNTTEDQIVNTTEEQIVNTTEDQIVNTTEDQIVNTTEDQIVNTTEDQIVNTTEDQIVNTTEDQIVNTTEDQIVNTTEDQIVNTTEDQIVNTTEDQIVNTTEDQIVNTTEDQIVNTSEDQIVNTTEDQIVNTTEDQIVNTTEDQIVNTTEDQIVNTTEDRIVNTTEDQIVNTTEDQIVNTTEDRIVNTTEDRIVNTTEDQIANTTEDQIVNTTEDQIANTTEDQIVNTTEDQIVNTTEDQIVNKTGLNDNEELIEEIPRVGRNCFESSLRKPNVDVSDSKDSQGNVEIQIISDEKELNIKYSIDQTNLNVYQNSIGKNSNSGKKSDSDFDPDREFVHLNHPKSSSSSSNEVNQSDIKIEFVQADLPKDFDIPESKEETVAEGWENFHLDESSQKTMELLAPELLKLSEGAIEIMSMKQKSTSKTKMSKTSETSVFGNNCVETDVKPSDPCLVSNGSIKHNPPNSKTCDIFKTNETHSMLKSPDQSPETKKDNLFMPTESYDISAKHSEQCKDNLFMPTESYDISAKHSEQCKDNLFMPTESYDISAKHSEQGEGNLFMPTESYDISTKHSEQGKDNLFMPTESYDISAKHIEQGKDNLFMPTESNDISAKHSEQGKDNFFMPTESNDISAKHSEQCKDNLFMPTESYDISAKHSEQDKDKMENLANKNRIKVDPGSSEISDSVKIHKVNHCVNGEKSSNKGNNFSSGSISVDYLNRISVSDNETSKTSQDKNERSLRIRESPPTNPSVASCQDDNLFSLDKDIDLMSFIGPSPCTILQALTMSNANDFFSLERLETIGDSFLKFAITVYLYCTYPGIHEGKLSYLRSKQVSNCNLYRLGKKKGLPEIMISTKFEPNENWIPSGYVINESKQRGPIQTVMISMCSSAIKPAAASINVSKRQEINANENSNASVRISCHHRSNGNLSRSSRMVNMQQLKFKQELEEVSRCQEVENHEDQQDFTRQLQPYNLRTQHIIPDKSVADVVEALIGCYLTSCGKRGALLFMSWLGLHVFPRKDNYLDNSESVSYFEELKVPPSPQLRHVTKSDQLLSSLLDGYDAFEDSIGYCFRDRSYLLQAFTHASYHYNTVTDCYQRLEFLGDAILDYVITRHLFEDSRKYSPGVLTDLRSALVNNNIFAALAVKWNFHRYFKAVSPALFYVIERFVSKQKDNNDLIQLVDEVGDEDDTVEMEIPKALGDIFESVAGAIYLDSGMSLDTVWNVYHRMMKPQIDQYLEQIPKSPVRELLEMEPETAKFEKPERTMEGKIRVTVNVVGKGVFVGLGRNYRIAKSSAAKKALKNIKTLQEQGLI